MLGESILSLSTMFIFDFEIVPTVWNWNCSDSLELFRQFGIVPTVWNGSDSLELFRQCGIVPTEWYFLFFILFMLSS